MRKTDRSLEIRFSSTMAHIDDVCTSATLFLESKGRLFTPHIFAANLVIREGLTNAVRHGNENDPGKMVAFCLEIGRQNTIRLSIEDQGAGFDWRRSRASTLSDLEEHGRGMPIMGTYFDRCRYNEKGNILYLEKDIRP